MIEMTTKNTAEAVFDVSEVNTAEITKNAVEVEKPYKFRQLCAEDVFPMLTIIRKIGIKEFKECFSKETLESIVDLFTKGAVPEDGNANAENTMAAVGISILPSVLDIADVLLSNIPKCETDIYKFLENISNLSVGEIKKLPMADFFGMIVDVVKKEEFKDFFKVVSKLFN